MPLHPHRPVVGVDLGHAQRGVDAVEVAVRHEQRRQPGDRRGARRPGRGGALCGPGQADRPPDRVDALALRRATGQAARRAATATAPPASRGSAADRRSAFGPSAATARAPTSPGTSSQQQPERRDTCGRADDADPERARAVDLRVARTTPRSRPRPSARCRPRRRETPEPEHAERRRRAVAETTSTFADQERLVLRPEPSRSRPARASPASGRSSRPPIAITCERAPGTIAASSSDTPSMTATARNPAARRASAAGASAPREARRLRSRVQANAAA